MRAPGASVPVRVRAGTQLVAAAAGVERRRVEGHAGVFLALVVVNLPDEFAII